jgi:hypothetical protein
MSEPRFKFEDSPDHQMNNVTSDSDAPFVHAVRSGGGRYENIRIGASKRAWWIAGGAFLISVLLGPLLVNYLTKLLEWS